MADEVGENKKEKEMKNGTESTKSEPGESDPCIDEKGKKKPFWKDTEDKLRKKSGLSKKGLYVALCAAFLLIVLFIVVVSLASCWPTTPHHLQFPVCHDSACLRASSQVREFLDESKSPCEDIWGWACGRWLSKHKLPADRSLWNQREELVKQEASRVRELVTTLKLPLLIGRVDWKLKYLYEACLDIDNVNSDRSHPLTTIISELGGWQILRDWNEADFDRKYLLQQLHVKYGASPFFKISVVPNPSSPGTSSIQVSPSGLGLPGRNYYYGPAENPVQQAYVQLIRDVVLNLSATKTDAERFGKNIFHYEKRIAEITPESFELENPVLTNHPIKLSELTLTAPSLPLQDTLTAMFPEAAIGGETEIIVTSPDYLSKVSQIIATTDRAILNGYMMWTLVREYLPYMSTDLTSSIDSFKTELLGIQAPLQRWEFCSNLLRKFMGLGVESLLEHKHPISEKTKKEVERIFQSIRNVAYRKISKYSTVRDLHRHLKGKLDALNLQIGLPEDVKSEANLKSYYTKLNVLKANLFQSYKNGIVFLKKVEEKRLIFGLQAGKSKNQSFDYVVEKLFNNPYDVSYEPSTNTIIVPRALLINPTFESNYPKSVIYGRLGVDIARALLESILPYNSGWTANLKLLSPYHMIVNESISSLRYPRKCLVKYLINSELVGSPEIANLTSLSTYKYLSSLKIAHEAMMNVVSSEEHIHQPSLEKFDDSALFFLTSAQTQCSISTHQQRTFENQNYYRLSQQSQLYTSWTQLSSFSTAFNCHFDEKMQCKDQL